MKQCRSLNEIEKFLEVNRRDRVARCGYFFAVHVVSAPLARVTISLQLWNKWQLETPLKF